MSKLIDRKKAVKIMIFTVLIIVLLSFFGGFQSAKKKVVDKASGVIEERFNKKPEVKLIKYNHFGYRKLNRNSRFYLEVTDKKWSGWIDANTYGMKHRIQSLNGKSHLTKYKDGTVDTFRVADRRPPEEFVFKLKSLSSKDTLLVRTW